MILDQPSNIAQPSRADSSSSTVGKPSMLSKQFDTANTTEEHRKKGTFFYKRELVYPFSLGQRVPSSFLFSVCLYITPEWVTATLQQATTKPKSQTFLSEVSQASQELRQTLIPGPRGSDAQPPEGLSGPPAKHNHPGGNASHAYHYTIPTKPRPNAKRPSSAPRDIP
ncbi:hypothetical protein CRG98_031244 [Punica granatum]|uniref:Uncharacterized protein n=1 Tax=Punica granatum TaxID=22663 RepID=A0A2I0IWI9_PUNGR|nr:hypothetical protein CRG98_031244 [Punica granatum]